MSVLQNLPDTPSVQSENFFFYIWLCARSWLHNDENPTPIAVFVLELFNLQYPTFYFEIDSSNSHVCLKTELLVRD